MKKILPVVLCLLFFGIASVVVSTTVYATNGMNMEGYGPVATGMGGASMAYDNGTAAMMNNPATLGLMPEGNRLDVAFGYLGPNVKASNDSGVSSTSSANAFYMPAIGWIQKSGQMSYGIGVFSQGGMGAKYDANSFLAYGSGEEVRSELGVGRVIVPFAYQINKDFSVAATVDFVWASLDLKMALNGMQFGDLVAPLGGSQTYGTASGTMVDTLVGAFTVPQGPCGGVPCLSGLNWARFDFADKSAFSGAAKGNGFAGKIGGVYRVSDAFSLGATYHSKTSLGDLETTGATLSMNVVGPATLGQPTTIPVTGKISIKDFQWPQTVGAGMAFQASPDLIIVFDYKWINWADVMKSFKMSFTADANQASPAAAQFGLGGQSMDAELYQKWKDQNVFMIGVGYKINADWTIRGGINYANNPIPDQYLNALFPAIEETHVTLGGGYMINKASAVDVSFTYAPEVKQTSGAGAPEGATVKHSQTNAQIMYSLRF